MTHDPLCPWNQPCPGSYERGPHEFVPLDPPDLPLACYHCTSTECQCDLVSKVRADERSACIARIDDVFIDDHVKWNMPLIEAQAALREVQP